MHIALFSLCLRWLPKHHFKWGLAIKVSGGLCWPMYVSIESGIEEFSLNLRFFAVGKKIFWLPFAIATHTHTRAQPTHVERTTRNGTDITQPSYASHIFSALHRTGQGAHIVCRAFLPWHQSKIIFCSQSFLRPALMLCWARSPAHTSAIFECERRRFGKLNWKFS